MLPRVRRWISTEQEGFQPPVHLRDRLLQGRLGPSALPGSRSVLASACPEVTAVRPGSPSYRTHATGTRSALSCPLPVVYKLAVMPSARGGLADDVVHDGVPESVTVRALGCTPGCANHPGLRS